MSRIDRILESVTGRYARNYTVHVNSMAIAMHMGDEPARRDAFQRLREVIRETMGVAEVLGATEVLRAAAGVGGNNGERFRARLRHGTHACETNAMLRMCEMHTGEELQDYASEGLVFDDTDQTAIPNVTFLEAVEDMVERAPVALRDAADRTAKKIAQLYSEDHVIAFARSAEEAVTEKVQAMFADAVERGITEDAVAKSVTEKVREIAEFTEPWSESYARMAFRTNFNTAVTAGRFRQVQDPDIQEVVPAFQFVAAGPPVSRGGDTRDNHFLAHGLIFKVTNPVWGKLAPPLGYF